MDIASDKYGNYESGKHKREKRDLNTLLQVQPTVRYSSFYTRKTGFTEISKNFARYRYKNNFVGLSNNYVKRSN